MELVEDATMIKICEHLFCNICFNRCFTKPYDDPYEKCDECEYYRDQCDCELFVLHECPY